MLALVAPIVVSLLAVAALALAGEDAPRGGQAGAREPRPAPPAAPAEPQAESRPVPQAREPVTPRPASRTYGRVRWQRSAALGDPAAGRLARGVRLPAEGRRFFTWDPVLRRSPNRPWRRHGTDRLVRVLLAVSRALARDHPAAPRMAIGDLSRPRGGDFGPQFGYIGHASHQNGLDADVYYPRSDGRERAPRDARDIDRGLSQYLVDRFVAAGASVVFVGPSTGLRGAAGRVQVLTNHDNHLHLRLPPAGPPGRRLPGN